MVIDAPAAAVAVGQMATEHGGRIKKGLAGWLSVG